MAAEPNILLVEDSEDDAKLLQKLFAKAGLSTPIHVVADGVEAMSYLLGRDKFADRTNFPEPNILLIDLHMPRVNGLELMSWLQTQPDFEHLIIVALSGSAEQDEIDRAYQTGANSYLLKPGSAIELERVVNSFLNYWVRSNYLPRPVRFRSDSQGN
jgi:CheY-like chemotaxis protein